MTTTAERLARHPGFRWSPGMSDSDEWRFIGDMEPRHPVPAPTWGHPVHGAEVRYGPSPPDLTDPGTGGCIRHQASALWRGLGHEAHEEPPNVVVYLDGCGEPVQWWDGGNDDDTWWIEAWALCLLAGLERAAEVAGA